MNLPNGFQITFKNYHDHPPSHFKGNKFLSSFIDLIVKSRRLRNLKKMAPDIADVALSTLANPIAGVGKIVQKVAKKIKDETN